MLALLLSMVNAIAMYVMPTMIKVVIVTAELHSSLT